MSYNLYTGAKFEVSNGVINVYEVLRVTETHVYYNDAVSMVSRRATIATFLKFLEQANAKQV